MRALFKHLSSKSLKDGFQKYGINLMTASAVAGFITHVANLAGKSKLTIFGVWVTGLALFLFGLYKFDSK